VSAAPDVQRGMLLQEAIAAIEEQGLTVFYSSDLIKPWLRVAENPTSAEPHQLLAEILLPLGLATQPGPDGSVLVVRGASAASDPLPTGGIAGVVRERAEGRPVAGAAVSLLEPRRRVVTGQNGRFVFDDLAAGSYLVRVLYPGNANETARPIEVLEDQTAVVRIEIDTTPTAALEEIVVAASQYELTRAVGASHSLLTSEDIEYLPDFGDDALRAVSRLPGTSTNGVSARSNVRGGEVGETLVRFDSLRLYDPFHLEDFQSIFSTVDPRVISSMNIYTGGFPAVFGDRMSSVIDVASLDAPAERYHEIAMSFFNASALSSGEFGQGDGEWLASIRRSNLDVLYDARSTNFGRPRYLDAFAKISFDVNDALRLTGSYLYFADDITLTDGDGDKQASAEGDDRYVWLRLDHALSPDLGGSTLVARSRLVSDRAGSTEEPGLSTGSLADHRSFTILSAQSDWTWRPSDGVLFEFGAGLTRSEGRYGYRDEVDFDVLFATPGASGETSRARDIRIAPRGDRYSLYGSVRYGPTDRLTTDFGLRWDKQTLDPAHSDSLSPRIGVRYRLGERTFLRGSWGRFHQSQTINELQVEDGIRGYFAPQRSEHTVIGFEHGFEQGIQLRVEAYDKDMSSLRPRHENLLNSLTLLPEIKPDRIRITPMSASARGVELFLSQRLQYPLTWWFGYSWSRVKDRVDDGKIYRSWDQTHAISAGLNWDTPKWNLGLGLIYRSGWPTTPVILDDAGPVPVVQASRRNSDRVDFYRSADLRLTRKFELERSSLSIFLELTNLFGRENPCCVEYEILPEDEGGGLQLQTLDYLPTIPSIGFVWSF
jgi:hypothetical protein